MAARRLIALLLVLLFLSSLAAALAPVQRSAQTTSSTSTTESTTTQADPTAPSTLPQAATGEPRLIRHSVDARRPEPAVIRARVGDQLQLRVSASESGTVELADLGPTEDVGKSQPAFFDVLLRTPGTFKVRLLDPERDTEIARIVVGAGATPDGRTSK